MCLWVVMGVWVNCNWGGCFNGELSDGVALWFQNYHSPYDMHLVKLCLHLSAE